MEVSSPTWNGFWIKFSFNDFCMVFGGVDVADVKTVINTAFGPTEALLKKLIPDAWVDKAIGAVKGIIVDRYENLKWLNRHSGKKGIKFFYNIFYFSITKYERRGDRADWYYKPCLG